MSRRVLLVHNFYQQGGGEDQVFAAEAEMLRRRGHQVFLYSDDNDRIEGQAKLKTALQTVWSSYSYHRLCRTIQENRVDVCHFHNTFPLISPSAYYASQSLNVPVIQTLHNYRLICPGSLLMRDGQVCEECVGRRIPWPGAVHKCYRDSYSASTVTAAAISAHNVFGTWAEQVDRFIALTQFARTKFIQGGLPAAKVVVKGNFVESASGVGAGQGGYALFVGRLAKEKGITTLLEAWKRIGASLPLRIAGGGPLANVVQEAALVNSSVRWLGEIGRSEVLAQMRNARMLICPSTWYEGFPMTILESFAAGLPIIASDLGSLSELIQPQRTGLLFSPGNAEDLASKVEWALAHGDRLREMGMCARRQYETNYTEDKNYLSLMSIYDSVLRDAPDSYSMAEPAVGLQ